MTNGDEYLSYEEVLQELQINRSQLNQLIREGRLREHVVSGETKFRRTEAEEVRKSLGKRPTVAEGEQEEPPTEQLEEGEVPPARTPETALVGGGPAESPETIVLEEGEEAGPPETIVLPEEGEGPPETVALAEGQEPETDLLEEAGAGMGLDRDTEILEEGGAGGEEFELEVEEGEEFELEKPLAEEPAPSETAMETELDLAAAGAETAEEGELFDFTQELAEEDFELQEGEGTEEAEIITDVLDLGVEEEVAEEDLLSEIMDIEEEQAAGFEDIEEREEITAEITTLEEPTYEDSELGEVLEAAEGMEFAEEMPEEEFEVPYAAEPVLGVEAPVGALPIVLLALTIVVMFIGALFLIENGYRPEFSTHLTGWNPFGP